MEIKRFVPAVVVAYAVLLASSYLIHGVWLLPIYRENPESWRPEDEMQAKMWMMWVGQFLFTVLFAYVYTRGVEDKPWVGQGIRYGFLMVLFALVPFLLGNYVVYPVPDTLLVRWMAAGAVQFILMGLVVAFFLRKGPG